MQRVGLDGREREAVAAIVRDDEEYQSSGGSLFDGTIAGLFNDSRDIVSTAPKQEHQLTVTEDGRDSEGALANVTEKERPGSVRVRTMPF